MNRHRRRRHWRQLLLPGALLLAVVVLGLLHVVPFESRRAELEKQATARFGQPVKIGALRLALLPHRHWRLENLSIGERGQIRAPLAKLSPGDGDNFAAAELETPTVSAEGLGWLLFAPPAADMRFGRVALRQAKLDIAGLHLLELDAAAEMAADGRWRKIAASAANGLRVELEAGADAATLRIEAATLAPPLAGMPELSAFSAAGIVNRNGLQLTAFDGTFRAGSLGGTARLAFGAAPVLEGELRAKQLDAAKLLPKLLTFGWLSGQGSFALPLGEGQPRLAGAFGIENGSLAGVDVGSVLRDTGIGGETRFTLLRGDLLYENGALRLEPVTLEAGAMSASGAARVGADGQVAGRLAARLATGPVRSQAQLELAGSIEAPLGSKFSWVRRQ